nr:enoyl-CoA hydratase/isomerase family protein [Streptomyces sp. NBC_00899]
MTLTAPDAPAFTGLDVRRDGAVLHVQLCSGPGNVLTAECIRELTTLLSAVRDESEVRVVILAGAGDDFCLGGDRRGITASLQADPSGAALRASTQGARELCEVLEALPAVTIARLHGRVVGAGLALAAFTDLRIAATTCQLRLPEIGLGMAPAWGGALGRLISEAGAARIRELLLTGAPVDAAAAGRMSLVNKVCGEEDLDAEVEAWARPLSRWPQQAVATTKLMLRAHAGRDRLVDGAPSTHSSWQRWPQPGRRRLPGPPRWPGRGPWLSAVRTHARLRVRHRGMERTPSCTLPSGRTRHPYAPRMRLFRSRGRADASQVTRSPVSQATALYMAGRYVAAEAEARAVAAARSWRPDDQYALVASSIAALAMSAQGRQAEAAAAYDVLLPDFGRVFGAEDPQTLKLRSDRARVIAMLGRHAESEAECAAVGRGRRPAQVRKCCSWRLPLALG